MDDATNKIMRKSKSLPGDPGSFTDYKDYILSEPDMQKSELFRTYVMMTRDHNIHNCVAAYAIFRTEGVGIENAMDFIFERRSGKMQHPYFGYLPAEAPFEPNSEKAVDELLDIEQGLNERIDGEPGEYGLHEVCYIC